MPIQTIRAKNQITLPAKIMDQAGLRQGDPIVFSALPAGGIAIRRSGQTPEGPSMLQWAQSIAESIPGLEDIDWEPERLPSGFREIDLE